MEEKFSSIQHLEMLLSIGSSIELFEKKGWANMKNRPKTTKHGYINQQVFEFSLSLFLHTQN